MSYNASHIEVLEGLEGVRRRPGMYVGGTDIKALHHLIAEVLDNATDEAGAGYADRIRLRLGVDGSVEVHDNGRGIPVDPLEKYPDKSALEIILTKLHAGGKFHDKAYATAGGLNGVGISVVNALSAWTEVKVERDGYQWQQRFSRGLPEGPLVQLGATSKRGTQVTFMPDAEIFPEIKFQVDRVVEMCRAKAYLHRGVSITVKVDETGENFKFHFPGGIYDFLRHWVADKECIVEGMFVGNVEKNAANDTPRLEWAMAWTHEEKSEILSYCNTIPTTLGGTHEAGLRTALVRGFREYAEAHNLVAKGLVIIADDILDGLFAVLSIFIYEPEFSGQTKEKLSNPGVTRQVDGIIKDHLDHWLHGNTEQSTRLVNAVVERAQERLDRKKFASRVKRKSATTRLTLPGKLTDCTTSDSGQSELFIVEGDSAGGSAKQARDRYNQAILPLRGKILNVEQANLDKLEKNTEIQSLVTAIGAGCGRHFEVSNLRYGRIIIMTDADVDGAHIASLLLTFFYRFMAKLIDGGHLYLAQPPLYRITQGAFSQYALDEEEKDKIIRKLEKKKQKIDISRFKGLGEMAPAQLRETTMSPKTRRLLRVYVDDDASTHGTFDRLMGKRPSERYNFIQESAHFARDHLDI